MEYSLEQAINTFKLVIGFILIILAIFFWVYSSQRDMVNEITANFAERVRYEGYIDKDMYETFMNQVSIAPYRVMFRHVSYNIDKSGRKVETVFTEKDIIDKIYSSTGIYKMKKGDDFVVVVSELQPSAFQALMQSITKSPAKYGVIASKGGMVFDDTN